MSEAPSAAATIVNEAVPVRGRSRELAEIATLVSRARTGRSGALVLTGPAGAGKTALLDAAIARAGSNVRVERMIAAESEMELAYAGLQQLCGRMMDAVGHLPGPQRQALEAAFGVLEAPAPSPFLVGLAVLGLLNEVAGNRALLCVVDDAQWLDVASARAVAFVARRLNSEGVAIVLATRGLDREFAELPQLAVEGLDDDDARELLRLAMPGALDARIRDQLIAEARGNPLALQELPRALSPADMAGGFALAGSMPLESRIEQSLVAQLEPLPHPTRLLLLVAAADPTGDPDLLWRASAALGLGPENLDAAEAADALTVGARVSFRHPLVRSAVYRTARPQDRRAVHAALADATSVQRDPDRRAWHRASATLTPDEDVATDLERSAARARTRGGAAAAAAFLERAAELSPAPTRRAQRLIDAAEAKLDAGAPEAALRLLDGARDHPLTALHQALIARLRARAGYALRRDSSGLRALLAAAQGLQPLDPPMARDTFMDALAAAAYAGRLGDGAVMAEVAQVILDATAADDSDRARDLILRGQALLVTDGLEAALPVLRRALRTFREEPPDPLELRWMWFGGRAAIDIWDVDTVRVLAERQVELARDAGVLTVLPIALSLLVSARVQDGRTDEADDCCDEIEAIQSATGHPLPPYCRIFITAYRGQVDDVQRWARELRAAAQACGEGSALSAANFAEAIAYNGAGRYAEAMDAGLRELPYTHELGTAMRTLPELVEAAVRSGEVAIAQDALGRLAAVTRPVGNDNALGTLALAEAQLREGDEAEALYLDAIERFEREGIPVMVGRARLLYGEMLRRRQRRTDARVQLRAAYNVLSRSGMNGFAARAARELSATGETLRVRSPDAIDQLTHQELNVARLARDGLTNRDIGAQLFISARTAEYHLRKVFVKLGISSRAELGTALEELD